MLASWVLMGFFFSFSPWICGHPGYNANPNFSFISFFLSLTLPSAHVKLHFLTSSNLYISKNACTRNSLVCCQWQKKGNEDVLPWLHTAGWRCVQLPLKFVNQNKFTFVVEPIVPQFCSQLHTTLVGVNSIAPRVPLSITSSHNRFIKGSFEAVYHWTCCERVNFIIKGKGSILMLSMIKLTKKI